MNFFFTKKKQMYGHLKKNNLRLDFSYNIAINITAKSKKKNTFSTLKHVSIGLPTVGIQRGVTLLFSLICINTYKLNILLIFNGKLLIFKPHLENMMNGFISFV